MHVYGIVTNAPIAWDAPLPEGEPYSPKNGELVPQQEMHGHIRAVGGQMTHVCVSSLGSALLERIGDGSLRTLAHMACRRCGGAIAVESNT